MNSIQDQTVVTVQYNLREGGPEGDVVETVDSKDPFSFLYGGGRMLPAFEENLAGKAEGEEFAFTLELEQAYGKHSDDQILEVPIDIFKNSPEEQKEILRVGYYLTLTDQDGRSHIGKVLDVGGESVRMDFNHAMAGKTLHFTGKVLNVREATGDEKVAGQPLED